MPNLKAMTQESKFYILEVEGNLKRHRVGDVKRLAHGLQDVWL